ncbi:hypothetical protein GN244_ATG16678 [Phytophthora infestans]|uniref:Uncharacterized protein n=1 Tax=Phytophthora infestans TaxID=4787 RepID=A0A833SBU9_PHYIN|nr:hypothetical protein GN244_ATG16678 [Phytophthora infestans]KAF4135107.1 hypothetical protein GN958_ATG15667 [Phytophthora infestans]
MLWCNYGYSCVADSLFRLVVVNAFAVCTSLNFSDIDVRWGSTEHRIYARRLWVGAVTAMLAIKPSRFQGGWCHLQAPG